MRSLLQHHKACSSMTFKVWYKLNPRGLLPEGMEWTFSANGPVDTSMINHGLNFRLVMACGLPEADGGLGKYLTGFLSIWFAGAWKLTVISLHEEIFLRWAKSAYGTQNGIPMPGVGLRFRFNLYSWDRWCVLLDYHCCRVPEVPAFGFLRTRVVSYCINKLIWFLFLIKCW